MSLESGQHLANLLLLRRIADGGMGSIWLAEDLALGREVAVKFLSADLAAEPEAVERFAREAEAVARIDSPYVPQIFGHGATPEGLPYIVMEMVWGKDLIDWVQTRGPMAAGAVAMLAEQVAQALERAHELGIVHRDVKPENIVISGSPDHFHAKLIDFGIARSTGSGHELRRLTHAGVIIGTPHYMSPEQLIAPGEVDARSDLWSLAVVLYWALTGQLPFGGGTFGEICGAVHRGHFRPVSELRPDLPATVDAWFDRALSRDVERRFTSAELMSRTLRVALTEHNVVVAAHGLAPLSIEPKHVETSFSLAPSHTPRVRHRPSPRGHRTWVLWTTGVVGLVATAALAVDLPSSSRTVIAVDTVARAEGTRPPVPSTATLAPSSAGVASWSTPADAKQIPQAVVTVEALPPLIPVSEARVTQEHGPSTEPSEWNDSKVWSPKPRVPARSATRHGVSPAAVIHASPLQVDAAPATRPAPALSSDWHPSDTLGEP
jgi:eukaryotic-like serine/threonine-protein kinase